MDVFQVIDLDRDLLRTRAVAPLTRALGARGACGLSDAPARSAARMRADWCLEALALELRWLGTMAEAAGRYGDAEAFVALETRAWDAFELVADEIADGAA